MAKLNRAQLRNLILKEMQKMKEDKFLSSYKGRDPHASNFRTVKKIACSECGYMMEKDEGVCEQCGSMHETDLNEGSCGSCGTCSTCSPMDDLDYDHPEYGRRTIHDITMLDPDSAYGVGFEAGTSGVFDGEDDIKIGNHKHYKGSYMAKSHLYKVNKYAEKLYHMIPDGHNLEDWMRTKLAQIADDIGEVYHALDHDIFEGDV